MSYIAEMKPSDIRFTQSSIAEHFNDDSESLEDTFRELLDNPEMDMPRIKVWHEDGEYWAMYGNRRLYIYKALEKYGLVKEIEVEVMTHVNRQKFLKKKTTKNKGRKIYIRQDRNKPRHEKLEARLGNIHEEWIADKRARAYKMSARDQRIGEGLWLKRASRDQGLGDSNFLNDVDSLSRASITSQRASCDPQPAVVRSSSIRQPSTYQYPSSRQPSTYQYPSSSSTDNRTNLWATGPTRPVSQPPPVSPPKPKKDDSWCTIL